MINLKGIWKYTMSLFDISKGDPMRSIPKPNTNDDVTNRLAHGTTQNHQAGEEISPDGLKFRERQIVAQQDGVTKALFGFLDSSNRFGFRIAADGVDAIELNALDRGSLIFDDQRPSPKVLKSDIVTLTHPVNTQLCFSDGYPQGYFTYPDGNITLELQQVTPLLFIVLYDSTPSQTLMDSTQIPLTHIAASAAGAVTEHFELYITGINVNTANFIIGLRTAPIASNTYYTTAYTLRFRYWMLAIQPELVPFQAAPS